MSTEICHCASVSLGDSSVAIDGFEVIHVVGKDFFQFFFEGFFEMIHKVCFGIYLIRTKTKAESGNLIADDQVFGPIQKIDIRIPAKNRMNRIRVHFRIFGNEFLTQ